MIDIRQHVGLHPVERIVSGGQTGVDRAALDWALEHGVDCGGWCPLGRRAEDEPIASRYPLRESETSGYEERTRLNVVDSDGTLILNAGKLDGGTALTVRFAIEERKPYTVVQLDAPGHDDAPRVRAWLAAHTVRTLNVAGPRESKRPGVYRLAYAFLDDVARTAAGSESSLERS
jgi:hypothetical protein